MSRISTSICIDREKVYGIMNKERMTMTDLSKDIGVSLSTVSTWMKSGKVSHDNIDIFALALGVDMNEVKGKSSDEIGPEQKKFMAWNGLKCRSKKEWTNINGLLLHSLIIRNFGSISQFADRVRMSDWSVSHYIEWNKMPSQYVSRYAAALDVEESDFVCVTDDAPIDILEERDGKVEKVKNFVEAGQNYADATEEAAIELSKIRPVNSSEVDILRARIEELEKKLAKYEKPKRKDKKDFQLQHRLADNMGSVLEKEGIGDSFVVSYVENAILTLADISMGNYTVSVIRDEFGDCKLQVRRNKLIEVDEKKYSDYVHDLYKGFIEQFNAR